MTTFGANLGGIRSLADIRARCYVDRSSGCWHWRLSTDGQGNPSLWLPGLRKRTSLGVAIAFLATGKPPERGHCWHVTCDTLNCANPAHRAEGTRRQQMARFAGQPIGLAHKARIVARRQASSRLAPEVIAEIRTSCEPLKEVCARHGVSHSHAWRIRTGRAWPQLGASVFNLGRMA